MHVEYFGECRENPRCTEDDLSDFPRRMREWLFNVMKELAERREISFYYQELQKQAEVIFFNLKINLFLFLDIFVHCQSIV